MSEPRTAEEWAKFLLDHFRREGLPEWESCDVLLASLKTYRLQGVRDALEQAAVTAESFGAEYDEDRAYDEGCRDISKKIAHAIRALKSEEV